MHGGGRRRSRAAHARPPVADKRSRVAVAPDWLRPWRPSLTQLSVAVAGAALLWFVIRVVQPIGPPSLGWVPLPLSPLLAALAAGRVARDPDLPPPARRFWQMITVSGGALTLAVLTNAYESLTGPGAPVLRTGPVTVALFTLAFLAMLYGLARLPLRERSRRDWLTGGLDVAIVLGGAAIMLWYVVGEEGARLRSLAGDVVVVVSLVALATIGALAAVQVSRERPSGVDPRAMCVLGCTIVVGTLCGAAAPLLASRPDLSVLMIAVPATYGGVPIAAALQRQGSTSGWDRLKPGRRRRHRKFSLLPYAAIVCTNALLLVSSRSDTHNTQIMILGSVALTGLVVVRQMVAFQENIRLLDRVDESLRDLQRNERRFQSLVQNSDDVISIVTPDGQLLYNSPGIERVLGLRPDALTGADARPNVHPDDMPVLRDLFGQLDGHPNLSVRGQVRIQHADGTWRWFEVTYTNLLHDPSVRGIVSNARDITETGATRTSSPTRRPTTS